MVTEVSADDCSGTETVAVGGGGNGNAAGVNGGNGGLSTFGATVKVRAGGGGGGITGSGGGVLGGGGGATTSGATSTAGTPAQLPTSANVAGISGAQTVSAGA